jgi:hypothetical protein
MPDVPLPDYGVWTGHRIPEDRSGWHGAIRRFYDYWFAMTPPGRLPGRQHIAPEDLVALLPRVFLIDVWRDPLRFRYRLVGTEVVWSRQRDPTGRWLDEVHPEGPLKPIIADRYRFIAQTGSATWRRGPSVWLRGAEHCVVENCLVPLARDGKTVDMIFGISIVFDKEGNELRI